MSDLRVTLPGVPPSQNQLMAARGHVFRPNAYTQWKADAILLINEARRKCRWHLAEPDAVYRVTLWWTRPDRRRRDADNAIKATADALATALGVDDCNFEFTTHRAYDSANPHVDIKVSVE